MAPCGVVRRPRRAPSESVFATSNEKLIFDETPESKTGRNVRPASVYQEKMKAQATRIRTKTAQTENAMV